MNASIYVLDFGTIVDNGKKVVFFAKNDIASCRRMVKQTCERVNSRKDNLIVHVVNSSSILVTDDNRYDWKIDDKVSDYILSIKDQTKVKCNTINTPYQVERIIAKVPKSQTSQFMLVG